MSTIKYEAESLNNTQDGTVIFNNSNCSNGKSVGWIGNGRFVVFNGITVSSSDTYRMTVSYLLSGQRDFYICVNNKFVFHKSLTGNDFSTPVTFTIDIPLNAGTNTIKFYNDSDWAPDLDCITISDIALNIISIDNLNDGDFISYKYLIIKGSFPSSIAYDTISVKNNDGVSVTWPVHTTKKIFKAVVNLEEGDNLIEINYSGYKKKFLYIQNGMKREGPAVRFIYMMPSDDNEGRFRAPTGVNNSLQSAKKRYTNMAYLAQSYFAEMMYDRGFGRQTFRIALPDETDPDDVVFLQYASKTFAQLCYYNSYEIRDGDPEPPGYNPQIYDELYYYVLNTISGRNTNYYVDAVMMSCSYYDIFYVGNEERIHSYVDTALGNYENRIALFGATSLYTIPEDFEDISTALYNMSAGYMLDNKYWETFNVSMGGLVHELGHAFGLKHYCDENAFFDWDTGTLVGSNGRDGIMGRGFYQMNHIISLREGQYDFDPSTDGACWNWAYTWKNSLNQYFDEQNDCGVLSANPWISDICGIKREGESLFNEFLSGDDVTPSIHDLRACSGWKDIVDLGLGASVAFKDIYIETAGLFNMEIYYVSGDDRYANISVNSGTAYSRFFPSTGSWQTVGSVSFNNIYLNSGINRIDIIANSDTWGPDIDKIELYRVS